MSLLIFLVFSVFFVVVIMFFVVLNIFLFGILVDGIFSRFLVSLVSSGKWDLFVFYYNRGLVFKGMEDCFLKFLSFDFIFCVIVFLGVVEIIYIFLRSCFIVDFLIFFVGGGYFRLYLVGVFICII